MKAWDAAEQGDEADEAFGGMVAGMDMPPHARAAPIERGHRFAADPQCWTDSTRAWTSIEGMGHVAGLVRPSGRGSGRATRGARIGPMATKNSCEQVDLGPRRVGIHSGSWPVDLARAAKSSGGDGEDFDARAGSTGPPHEGDPGHPGRLNLCFVAGRVRRYPETAVKRTMTADEGGPTRS